MLLLGFIYFCSVGVMIPFYLAWLDFWAKVMERETTETQFVEKHFAFCLLFWPLVLAYGIVKRVGWAVRDLVQPLFAARRARLERAAKNAKRYLREDHKKRLKSFDQKLRATDRHNVVSFARKK